MSRGQARGRISSNEFLKRILSDLALRACRGIVFVRQVLSQTQSSRRIVDLKDAPILLPGRRIPDHPSWFGKSNYDEPHHPVST
jgi:hypothetical protein